jgi:acetyltransferase
MWRTIENLRALYETPQLLEEERGDGAPDGEARRMIAEARAEGRTILTEYESKEILAAYCIPTVETLLAETA